VLACVSVAYLSSWTDDFVHAWLVWGLGHAMHVCCYEPTAQLRHLIGLPGLLAFECWLYY